MHLVYYQLSYQEHKMITILKWNLHFTVCVKSFSHCALLQELHACARTPAESRDRILKNPLSTPFILPAVEVEETRHQVLAAASFQRTDIIK